MAELDEAVRSSGDAPASAIFVTSQHDGRLIGSLSLLVSDSRNAPSRSKGDYRARFDGQHFRRGHRSSMGSTWYALCLRS
jgi:hypothetical protein